MSQEQEKYVPLDKNTKWRFCFELIRQRREKLTLSRRALAREAGISEATVRRIEGELHSPKASTMIKLANALAVTPKYFFGKA